ncbi:Phenylalanyl-tRNA synthetase beta chain [Thermodesulfobium narugense DSM 14796]|uniref:Phenylalanine--tRNA ligase beta subunit n=1 Tax=Thermodesulfobium narugense DSM 14796 TaxID=747365 RepID=M1E6V6_9BACT|nr:phenylalanine--tRNA ligase subunit beta [Thermodesulfobium narugense]AEE14328.1 Phenylalanyl-tRNA synthetase beta chain [Thermodesulfobium narugense DSM 14796]
MKVSLSWLSEILEESLDEYTVSNILQSSGIEVEQIDEVKTDFNKVVIGRIINHEKHPDADRLFVVDVDLGGEIKRIVTAATNLSVGDIVPVALHGSRLSTGTIIKKTKLRGILSEGMFCSPNELGFGKDHSGIMILNDEKFQIGSDLASVLGEKDYVFDLSIPANRPDLMSVVGVAREIGAKLRLKVKINDFECKDSNDFSPIKVRIDFPEGCLVYLGQWIEGVKVKPSSPFIAERLKKVGIRPINNVVDCTNYVMYLFGHPLHAFDMGKINNRIIVRRAFDNECLVLLDGSEVILNENDIVIADESGSIGLAGIMGAGNSEISNATTDVFLEAAIFNHVNIRRTSRRLGIRTEASIRFEKGLYWKDVSEIISFASKMIASVSDGILHKKIEIDGKVPESSKDIYLVPEKVNSILGTTFSKTDIQESLQNLGFKVECKDSSFRVSSPTYRLDIKEAEDLVEEVARFQGFDKIPSTLPGEPMPGFLPKKIELINKIKSYFANNGFTESISDSLISMEDVLKTNIISTDDIDKATFIENRVIKVLSPLSEEHSVLRTSMLEPLTMLLKRHLNRQIYDISFFEVGKVFKKINNSFLEENLLGLIATGKRQLDPWRLPVEDKNWSFYSFKGVFENFFRSFGIVDWEISSDVDYIFHPSISCAFVINDKKVLEIGEVNPRILHNWEINQTFFYAQLFVDEFLDLLEFKNVKHVFSVFPAATRDISMLVSKETFYSKIRNEIKMLECPILENISILDVYQGKGIPEDMKSITLSLRFRSEEKTLSNEEITEWVEKIIKKLKDNLGIQIRSEVN